MGKKRVMKIRIKLNKMEIGVNCLEKLQEKDFPSIMAALQNQNKSACMVKKRVISRLKRKADRKRN